jgi:hypothetical protein
MTRAKQSGAQRELQVLRGAHHLRIVQHLQQGSTVNPEGTARVPDATRCKSLRIAQHLSRATSGEFRMACVDCTAVAAGHSTADASWR